MNSSDYDRVRLLGPRQRQVLDQVLTGASDKEIAAGLGIARKTVKTHMQVLLTVFEVRSRTKLMAMLMVPRPELTQQGGA